MLSRFTPQKKGLAQRRKDAKEICCEGKVLCNAA